MKVSYIVGSVVLSFRASGLGVTVVSFDLKYKQ